MGRSRRIEVDDAVETERTQVGDAQRDDPGNVAQRAAPFVAVRRRIRQLTAADAVEDDQEDAWKGSQACWVEK
jgi:hypothetical protein